MVSPSPPPPSPLPLSLPPHPNPFSSSHTHAIRRQKSPTVMSFFDRARICKLFKEPRNQFGQAGGPVGQFYFSYRPARGCIVHRLAESVPRNRFLVSLNVYKYGLRCKTICLYSKLRMLTSKSVMLQFFFLLSLVELFLPQFR